VRSWHAPTASRRFFVAQLADLVVGDETLLGSHRREIVVVFTDLRNFHALRGDQRTEEVMGVLREYHHGHSDIGARRTKARSKRFTGDGIMGVSSTIRSRATDSGGACGPDGNWSLRDASKTFPHNGYRRGHDLPWGNRL